MQNAPRGAILSTFIKLPIVNKTFVLSIFELTYYTGFTVHKILVMEPKEHKIVLMDPKEHKILLMEPKEHKIVFMEPKEHKIVLMEPKELKIVLMEPKEDINKFNL